MIFKRPFQEYFILEISDTETKKMATLSIYECEVLDIKSMISQYYNLVKDGKYNIQFLLYCKVDIKTKIYKYCTTFKSTHNVKQIKEYLIKKNENNT